MARRTKNPTDPKVIEWNSIEMDIRRVRDERITAVRHHDHAQRIYCDKVIADLRATQIKNWEK